MIADEECCFDSPHILSGASSSSRMGWLRKSSRDFKHRPRISFSASCTFLPGFELRTSSKRAMMLSMFSFSPSAIVR